MSQAVVLEPVRPRLPPDVARAVSRLAERAHRFHRWAHHPLCAQYRGEVLAFGRKVRVCRGCAYVALGLAAGAATGAVAWALGGVAHGWLAAVAGLAVLAASSRWRLPKWLGRFVPALLVGASLASGLTGAACGAVAVAVGFAAYRGRQPNRAPCAACPQQGSKVCDGIRPVVRRERAVMRRAGALLSPKR